MNKYVIPLLIVFLIVFSWTASSNAQINNSFPTEDSKELKVQDILLLLLGENIEKAVNDYYSEFLAESPVVYPYQVEIVNVSRVGGFRSFHFLITLETIPVVGPHISVGKDRLIFEIAPTIPGQVKLKKYEHLETHELPQRLQYLLKDNKSL